MLKNKKRMLKNSASSGTMNRKVGYTIVCVGRSSAGVRVGRDAKPWAKPEVQAARGII